MLAALGGSRDPRVATIVLENYARLEPELQPRAIELLTQRPVWAKALLAAIGEKKIPASALNVNQVQRLFASRDKELIASGHREMGLGPHRAQSAARKGRGPGA